MSPSGPVDFEELVCFYESQWLPLELLVHGDTFYLRDLDL